MLVFTVKKGGWLEIKTSDGTLYAKVKESRKSGCSIGFLGPKKIKINRKVENIEQKISDFRKESD